MARQTGRWQDLDRRARRSEVLRAAGHIVVTWAIVLVAYFVLPLDRDRGAAVVLGLVGGLLLVAVLVAWEVRGIVQARIPLLRAAEALGLVLVVFLAVFSATYLALSVDDPARFSERLDHVGALYFTTTTFATVGFGDIAPRGDLTRGIVTVQMILDLVLVGLVARLLLQAARLGGSGADDADADAHDAG